MQVNGYEVGQEPTNDEMRVYRRVREFILRETAAQWMGGREHGGSLTDYEFDKLCNRFIKADFSAEEWEFLKREYDEIIEERN